MQGMTPLHHAVIYWHFDTIKLLIDRGADLTSLNKYGHTYEDMAHNRGYWALSELIRNEKSTNAAKIEKGESCKKNLQKFKVNFSFDKLFAPEKDNLISGRKFYAYPVFYPFNDLSTTFIATTHVPKRITELDTYLTKQKFLDDHKNHWLSAKGLL
jgi:hypothetical protein